MTGASSGIGQETARLFARAGWDCLAGVRSADARRAWIAEGTTDRAIARHVVPVTLDVTDEADRAGVVVTHTDGDEPGVAMTLLRYLRQIGLKPVAAGNIKGE